MHGVRDGSLSRRRLVGVAPAAARSRSDQRAAGAAAAALSNRRLSCGRSRGRPIRARARAGTRDDRRGIRTGRRAASVSDRVGAWRRAACADGCGAGRPRFRAGPDRLARRRYRRSCPRHVGNGDRAEDFGGARPVAAGLWPARLRDIAVPGYVGRADSGPAAAACAGSG